MWPYILLLTFPMIVQYVPIQNLTAIELDVFKRNSNKAIVTFWVGIFLLLVLRHETIGIDLPNYRLIFEFISKSDIKTSLGRSVEIGYSFLNKVVSVFSSDFRLLLIVVAVLSVLFIAKVYAKNSFDAALTIVLFVNLSNFALLFSGLRQTIAISLGFLAFEFVREKKLVRFLIVVVIAMLFHTSAFMLLLMYPTYHARITKESLIVVVPVIGVVFAFNRQIFTILGLVLSRYTKYDATITSTGAYTMLILFILFAIFSYLIPDESKLDDDAIGFRNFLLLSVVLQIFASLHPLAMRMNYYYIAFIPLLMPKIIESRSRKWNQVAIVARYVMVVFFFAYFCIGASSGDNNSLQTFPYRFFWEDVG